MCYPGAARLINIQKVLHEVSLHSSGKGSVESIKEGLALLRHLANNGAGLFIDNPGLEKELAALEDINPSYLALIANTKPKAMQETLRDQARHQNQRVDIFLKQPQALSEADYEQHISNVVYKAVISLPKAGEVLFETPMGNITGPAKIFTPLINALASGPKSFAELRQIDIFKNEPGLLLQSLNMLMWDDYIHPLRADAETVTFHS